jgi:hypothetical protein
MTPGEITSIVIGALTGTGALCSAVWWLSKMSSGVGQLKTDVTQISATTTKTLDSVSEFKLQIHDHDRRLTRLETEYEE